MYFFFWCEDGGIGMVWVIRLLMWDGRSGWIALIGFWSGWLGNKISSGQSVGVFLLGQWGQLHYFYQFIYLMNYLFLNFWYYFKHKFSLFPTPASKKICICDLFACLLVYSTILFLHMLSLCSRPVYVCT